MKRKGIVSGMEKQYLVKKADRPIDWTVSVPGSKSMTNRALLMAALTDGTVELDGVLFSDDSRYFLRSLESLGFLVTADEQTAHVSVAGCGGVIPAKEAEIYVGSAGTAARFLTAMLGFSDGIYTIQASEQMKRRPMQELFALLSDAGAEITYLEKEGFLPIMIKGCMAGKTSVCGSEKPLEVSLDISKSTQFLSALLLIAPMIRQGMSIHITSEKTDGSYIRITRKMLADAGVDSVFDGKTYLVGAGAAYTKMRYQIEPDVSAACYFYAAAAVTGGRALVRHVYFENSQGDMQFLRVLESMGCVVTQKEDGIEVVGAKGGRLKGISVDMNDFSDQALTLAAIAPFADGAVQILRIGHIRRQECDRLHAITSELTKRGICCEEQEDAVTIYPGTPQAGEVETYDDHRVAMAFSLLGLRTDGIVIRNPECCKKTFEHYFDVLDELMQSNTTAK